MRNDEHLVTFLHSDGTNPIALTRDGIIMFEEEPLLDIRTWK
jgi:hypothetical protein